MNITKSHRIVALAACVTLIAACGSDDASSADTTTAATTTPETTPDTTEAAVTTEAPAPETTDAPATSEAPETTEAPAPEATDAPDASTAGTIGEVSGANGATFIPGYTSFATGYDAAINGEGPVTALMPSDEGFIAFTTAYPNLSNEMREDLEALDVLLQYHVIDGVLLAEAMASGTDLDTLQGEPITVEVTDGVVVFNGGQASITIADLEASNGVVHIIDGILLPPSMAATAS